MKYWGWRDDSLVKDHQLFSQRTWVLLQHPHSNSVLTLNPRNLMPSSGSLGTRHKHGSKTYMQTKHIKYNENLKISTNFYMKIFVLPSITNRVKPFEFVQTNQPCCMVEESQQPVRSTLTPLSKALEPLGHNLITYHYLSPKVSSSQQSGGKWTSNHRASKIWAMPSSC